MYDKFGFLMRRSFSLNYSRIAELRNVNEDSGLGPEEEEKLLNDVAHELEANK